MKSTIIRLCWVALALLPMELAAQATGRITGTVTSDAGTPVEGAAVSAAGRGTVTGADGSFTLAEVPVGTHTLRASRIGYDEATRSVTVAAGQTARADLELEAQAVALEGVVAIGYGTQQRRDLTGAVASVSGEAITKQPIASIQEGLQGRVPGVNVVQNSSAPGGGISMRIRGVTSILNGSEPLYVIDGFPVSGQTQFSTNPGRGTSNEGSDFTVSQNPLAALSLSEIESIEVLKDASAAAIYGVRGANGVVLITTKRGRSGAPRVSYSGYAGMQTTAKKIDMMNAAEYQEIYNVQETNAGFPPIFTEPPQFNTDWQDLIFREAPVQDHHVSVSGSTDAVGYLLSAGFFDQEGIVRGSDFARYSLRANLDINPSEKFTFGNSLTVSRAIINGANTEGESTTGTTLVALRMSPIMPVYQPDGTYSHHQLLGALGLPDAQGTDNPIAQINEFSDENVLTRVLGTVFGEYSLTDELSLRVSLGADLETQDRHVFFSSRYDAEDDLSAATVSQVSRQSLLNENSLNYDRTFGSHDISVLSGFTVQTEEEEYRGINSRGFATDVTGPYALGSGSVTPSVGSAFADYNILSFLGRVNYGYNDTYLLTVTGRRDGSSKFAEGNKWAFFPSVAGAWRISNEPFMQGLSGYVGSLKLRAGYGVVGNQELPAYQSLALLQSDNYNFGDGTIVNGFAPFRVAVPNLTWETTAQTNFGLDLSVLDNRLNLSGDYYIKKTKDLLLLVFLPETSGILEPSVQNLGQMENVGWELAADGFLVTTPDFSWNLGLNLSSNRNEITSLGDENIYGDLSFVSNRTTFSGSTVRSYVQTGEPIGVFWGYKTDGLYRNQAEADAGQTIQAGVVPGMVRFVDVNNDGVLNDDDRTVLGSPFPDLIYGMSNRLSYKALELSLFLQGQQGGLVYNMMRRFSSGINRGQNVLRERLDYWTPENPDAKWPTPNAAPPRTAGTTDLGDSDWYLEDASYLRLRDVTLTYDLPDRLFAGTGGSVFLKAHNLFTLTDYTGYNPDTNGRAGMTAAYGYDVSSYPLARTYTLGVTLDF